MPCTYCESLAKQRLNWRNMIKKKIYKSILVLMVSLSLASGPITQNEIRKMLEDISGTGEVQIQEVDEEKPEEID